MKAARSLVAALACTVALASKTAINNVATPAKRTTKYLSNSGTNNLLTAAWLVEA